MAAFDTSGESSRISEIITEQMIQVSEIYERSHTIRTSCDILHNSVADPGFIGENKLSANYFVRDAVRNLFLYGFFIYRVTRKRSADRAGQQISAIDHNKVTLDFKRGEWIPVLRDTADDNSKKVRMILWRTPSLDFGLDSPAKAGLIPAQRLEDLLANIRVRDALNSKRALYTALEELQSTSSGKPWFSGAANQGYTGLYGFGATQELDVDELIANREEMHTRLGSMTRAIQSRNFAGMPAGASFDALLPSIDDSEHQEFLVTDGSKGLFQAAHLAGENDLRGIIRTFQIDTYTATGTPPQAAGVNSNTERVAGSERITNFALDSFDHRSKELRRIINPVLSELFDVQFDERLEISKLTRLMPILTDAAAMRLSARAYTIDEEDIDQERLKIMRDSLLQPAGAKQQSVGQAAVRKNQGNTNAETDDVTKKMNAEDKSAKLAED